MLRMFPVDYIGLPTQVPRQVPSQLPSDLDDPTTAMPPSQVPSDLDDPITAITSSQVPRDPNQGPLSQVSKIRAKAALPKRAMPNSKTFVTLAHLKMRCSHVPGVLLSSPSDGGDVGPSLEKEKSRQDVSKPSPLSNSSIGPTRPGSMILLEDMRMEKVDDSVFVGSDSTTEADGSCVYKALQSCGMTRVTRDGLDQQINQALIDRKRASPTNKYGEEWETGHVGRPGKAWSLDVVLLELKEKYPGGFLWRDQTAAYMCSRAAAGKKFYVAGLLDHNQWSSPGAEVEGLHRAEWHHAICVDRKRNIIIDSNVATPVSFKVSELVMLLRQEWFLEIWKIKHVAPSQKVRAKKRRKFA